MATEIKGYVFGNVLFVDEETMNQLRGSVVSFPADALAAGVLASEYREALALREARVQAVNESGRITAAQARRACELLTTRTASNAVEVHDRLRKMEDR